jgi:hypothetical protein
MSLIYWQLSYFKQTPLTFIILKGFTTLSEYFKVEAGSDLTKNIFTKDIRVDKPARFKRFVE